MCLGEKNTFASQDRRYQSFCISKTKLEKNLEMAIFSCACGGAGSVVVVGALMEAGKAHMVLRH